MYKAEHRTLHRQGSDGIENHQRQVGTDALQLFLRGGILLSQLRQQESLVYVGVECLPCEVVGSGIDEMHLD